MSALTKTVPFDELVEIVQQSRRENKTVVHCHGVFDLLHIGHIRYLQSAKEHGDVLIVTVTPDHFVNKGPHRPVFEERLRTQAIASLDCVDYVAVNQWPTAVEALRRLRPNVYTKGAEFRDRKTPEMLQEEAEAVSLGIRVEFIEDDITSSSSYLINHFLSPFSEQVDAYLAKRRKEWRADELLNRLKSAQDLRVVVVGDAILDEYVFCSTLGQSTKSPNVVGQFQTQETYLGGALSVANHLAGFCRNVQLITAIGSDEAGPNEICRKLRPEVQPRFVVRSTAPTIIKRQFREAYFGTILFELDFLDDSQMTGGERQSLDLALREALPQADLVVVADYGHGLLDDAAIQLICELSPYLAVSTPVSAANLGYHTVSKYRRADYLALAEQDLRLDQRSKDGEVEPMLAELTQTLQARRALVTVGSKGCVGYSAADGFVSAPALAIRVVDRLGAAEAAFAVTSLGAIADLPLDQLAFISNVAGAQAVAVMGNSRFIDELSLRRAVESLLK
jgi:rfaE bifunctional protein nucleotidyltransferase chain/domain